MSNVRQTPRQRIRWHSENADTRERSTHLPVDPTPVDQSALEQRRRVLFAIASGSATVALVGAGAVAVSMLPNDSSSPELSPEEQFRLQEIQAVRADICWERIPRGECLIPGYETGYAVPEAIPHIILLKLPPSLLHDLGSLPELEKITVRLEGSSVTDEQLRLLSTYNLKEISFDSRLIAPRKQLGEFAEVVRPTKVHYPLAQLVWNDEASGSETR